MTEKLKRGKDDFFEEGSTSFDKTRILQEAKECFNVTSAKPAKLINVLTKCVSILHSGDPLAKKEATDLFFHITRLFQYKEKSNVLRKLAYICIKALSHQAENVYVVTSILTNAINSVEDDPAVRASALRALCQISDASTFTPVEVYFKKSLVDKHPVVASAAISSLIRISQFNSDIVNKCTNEIQDALNSDSPMVQYHALGLRYNSCKDDRPSLTCLISNCIESGLKSPLAICLLIRIISNYINDYETGDNQAYCEYIKSQFSLQSEMIEFEAANALISLKSSTPDLKKLAISHLKNFLTSSKPAARYAAVRTLNENCRDKRFWSVNRIGDVCKVYLLHKRYRMGEDVVGILDFSCSNVLCAKYIVMLQCEDTQQVELKQEFCLGTLRTNFAIAMPAIKTELSTLHCVLSFLFYIADKEYPRSLFEDRAGTIELGPSDLETKPFSCDFPIAIYV